MNAILTLSKEEIEMIINSLCNYKAGQTSYSYELIKKIEMYLNAKLEEIK